jgi:hypothetical protein
VACLVGAGLATAALRWCQRSSEHRALLVLTQPEQLDELFRHPRLWKLVEQPGLTLHVWPGEELASKWTCPPALIVASINARLVWGADAASQAVLPQVQSVLRRSNAVLAECLPFEPSSLSNFWNNLALLPKAHHYRELRDAAQGLSVMIAGGGPSLKQALAWYKSNASRCLLFAGGAAIQGCAREGVQPDIAFLIDPTESQWDRSKLLRENDIPLVTTLRCHAPSVAAIRGPLLIVPRAEEIGYGDIVHHLLGLKSPSLEAEILDVGGFMMAFAIFLGAQRVLFAGRELCWTQNPYADGSQVLEPPVRISGEQQPIWSTSHWLSIAEATRLTVARHPEIDWRHCGAPSLPISGVRYQGLAEWGQGCNEIKKVNVFRQQLKSLPPEPVSKNAIDELRRELHQGLQQEAASSAGAQLTHRIVRVMEGLFQTVSEADSQTKGEWKDWLISTLQASWRM